MLRRLAATCMLSAAVYAATGQSVQSSTTGVLPSGGATLRYLLNRPHGAGPHPAVVIGHGSGPATKEECRTLAEGFERRGYATLCYDKRGVGGSTGRYENVTIENSPRVFATLADDLAAAVSFLAAERDIDPRRIGLAGGSQAGWIVPMAAALAKPAPVFMILLSGPTVSVGEEIVFSRVADGTSVPIDEAYARLDAYAGPRGFDPMPVLRTLDVRGLWLIGEADRSIPVRHTNRLLDDLIALGRPFRRVALKGADHSLLGADIWTEIDRFLATARP